MAEARSCGLFIVRGDPIHEFLLMKHPKRWDLPKGHVDPGETDLECAFRETVEETGIERDALDLDPDFRFVQRYKVNKRRYGDQPVDKELIIFLARLTRDVEIVVTEHESYEWFPWAPPNRIQAQTIDPLLASVEEFVGETSK